MMIPIHIPNSHYYDVMMVFVLSLGSFNIARHIHNRWLTNFWSIITTNAIVKSIIVILCLTVLPCPTLFSSTILGLLTVIIIGLFFGYGVVLLEIYMIRKLNRQIFFKKKYHHFPEGNQENKFLREARLKKTLQLTSKKMIRARGFQQIKNSSVQLAQLPNFINYSLGSVVIVAIAEEYLFRGYIFSIGKSFNSNIFFVGLMLTSIVCFAYSHVSNSWMDFLRKLPLSLLTTIGFLITGSLLTPILTHVYLNIYAFKKINQLT